MTRRFLHLMVFAAAVAAVAAPALGQSPREELGRADKYRILVDKVLMASTDWHMTEDQVREIAKAGFNVVVPRQGGTEPDRVRRVAELAAKHDMYYMAWMRGSLTATEGTRLVWDTGNTQDLYSPNADELWDWMTGIILEQARLSVEIPAILGAFLDFENYAKNKEGDCYPLSYDEKILGEFAAAKGIQIPELAPADRHPWLRDNGHDGAFRDFQIASWRQRCRNLREQVDAINPKFQFIVYPAPGTLFIRDAVYQEWATEAAPLVLATPQTYGRAWTVLTHREALDANRGKLREGMEEVRPFAIPVQYVGGIDPVVPGADPEFSGKNAVMISDVCDGYWVFYEGPEYGRADHRAYWRWFTRANREIAEGRFVMQYEPRQTPEPAAKTSFERKTNRPQVALYGMKLRMWDLVEATGKFELHELESVAPEYLAGLDAIVLQNFNFPLLRDSALVRTLQEYIRNGGGVLFAHDTIRFMESPLPEIAERVRPLQNVEAVYHVAETDLVVEAPHEAIGGLAAGTRFTPEFRDHMIFAPGDRGTVLIRNTFGDPVYVIGEYGKGRAAFAGSYYGYLSDLEGAEKQAFLSMLDWLAQD
ncbi:MAG: hypothetical protein JXR94_12685 [Candidatus Hydrogenedentes bacterium]|nr:hypothetical protein [Candidatus Hydrogenedentota bacterium]